MVRDRPQLLKHGFKVRGRDQGHWPTEMDWLFRLRDLGVHHGEGLRPLVEEMRTDQVVMFRPPRPKPSPQRTPGEPQTS
jgi:hypothetical protein